MRIGLTTSFGTASRESTSVVIVVWRNNRVSLGYKVGDFGPIY